MARAFTVSPEHGLADGQLHTFCPALLFGEADHCGLGKCEHRRRDDVQADIESKHHTSLGRCGMRQHATAVYIANGVYARCCGTETAVGDYPVPICHYSGSFQPVREHRPPADRHDGDRCGNSSAAFAPIIDD